MKAMYRTLVVDRLHQLEQGIEELAQEGYRVHTIGHEKDRDGGGYFWALLELDLGAMEILDRVMHREEPKGFTDEQERVLEALGVTQQELACATRLLQDPPDPYVWACIECKYQRIGHRHGTEDYGPICCQCANRRADGVPILEEVQSGK